MKMEHFSCSSFGKNLTIPVLKFGNLKSNKKIVLLGGVHGNEINGIFNMKLIIHKLTEVENDLDAKVICFPILNPVGFANNTRRMYNRDLNRSYFDSKPTNFTQYYANCLFEKYFHDANCIIDFHDSGSSYELLPHSRIHANDNELMKMSKSLMMDFTLLRVPEDGMLAQKSYKNNIKHITIESGGGGVVNSEYSHKVFNGLLNFLSEYKFLKNSKINSKASDSLVELMSRHKYKSKNPVVVNYFVELEEKVKEGQLLCKLYDPLLCKEISVFAKKDGYVFSKHIGSSVGANRVVIDIALDCCTYNVKSNPFIVEIIDF